MQKDESCWYLIRAERDRHILEANRAAAKKILMSNLQKTESVSEHCPSLITYMTMVCVIMTVVGASRVLFLCIVFL